MLGKHPVPIYITRFTYTSKLHDIIWIVALHCHYILSLYSASYTCVCSIGNLQYLQLPAVKAHYLYFVHAHHGKIFYVIVYIIIWHNITRENPLCTMRDIILLCARRTSIGKKCIIKYAIKFSRMRVNGYFLEKNLQDKRKYFWRSYNKLIITSHYTQLPLNIKYIILYTYVVCRICISIKGHEV